MKNFHIVQTTACLFLVVFLAQACKPSYPKCSSDKQCIDKGEVCVNGQCQECRDNNQCSLKYPDGKHICQDGRCEDKAVCHNDTDCKAFGEHLVCVANACVTPACQSDDDCYGGNKCVNHACAEHCSSNRDCKIDHTCKNNQCSYEASNVYGNISPTCRTQSATNGEVLELDPIHFEFNKHDLTDAARIELDRVVACLKEAPTKLHIVIEGHCDDRGTQEYNLALGERRAQTVLSYVKRLGVNNPRVTILSKGENEPLCAEQEDSCWARNRRVQFIQSTNSND